MSENQNSLPENDNTPTKADFLRLEQGLTELGIKFKPHNEGSNGSCVREYVILDDSAERPFGNLVFHERIINGQPEYTSALGKSQWEAEGTSDDDIREVGVIAFYKGFDDKYPTVDELLDFIKQQQQMRQVQVERRVAALQVETVSSEVIQQAKNEPSYSIADAEVQALSYPWDDEFVDHEPIVANHNYFINLPGAAEICGCATGIFIRGLQSDNPPIQFLMSVEMVDGVNRAVDSKEHWERTKNVDAEMAMRMLGTFFPIRNEGEKKYALAVYNALLNGDEDPDNPLDYPVYEDYVNSDTSG